MITRVVGVKFKNEGYKVDRQSIIKKLIGNERIFLKREPKNRFDRNAVAVLVGIDDKRRQIGYLKAELAGIVSEMWKEYMFLCFIHEINPGNKEQDTPWGISLEIKKRRKKHDMSKMSKKHKSQRSKQTKNTRHSRS